MSTENPDFFAENPKVFLLKIQIFLMKMQKRWESSVFGTHLFISLLGYQSCIS